MAFTDPTVADFKVYFVRDFPYGTDISKNVLDQDIQSAINDVGFNFNSGLFATQSNYSTGFLLLAAHFLVINLRASSQGIAGQYSWLEGSKSVGSVSESFNIPQRILDNPEFAMLSKTFYGAKYLFLILPLLTGNIFITHGRTTP